MIVLLDPISSGGHRLVPAKSTLGDVGGDMAFPSGMCPPSSALITSVVAPLSVCVVFLGQCFGL